MGIGRSAEGVCGVDKVLEAWLFRTGPIPIPVPGRNLISKWLNTDNRALCGFRFVSSHSGALRMTK